MDTKRILVISPSEISKDPRVVKHISVAMEFGEVVTCGYGQAPNGVQEHYEIPTSARFITRSFFNLLAIQFGMHAYAARRTQFYKSASSSLAGMSFDAVIANDVHSIQTVTDIFEPSIIWVDMHEYAPREAEHDWRWRLAFSRHISWLCKRNLTRVSVVSSVSNQICRQYSSDLHREIILIRNSAEYVQAAPARDLDEMGHPIRLVHVGAAIRARRLEDLIEAVGRRPGIATLHLYLIPTDSRYLDELTSLSRRYPNVQLPGPVEPDEIIGSIAGFDIGCVAIPPTSFNYENCLPNKFFQYVQARVPIISGPIPEVRAAIEEFDIGWVAKGFTVSDTIDCLDSLSIQDVQQKRHNLDDAAILLSSDIDNAMRRKIVRQVLNAQD